MHLYLHTVIWKKKQLIIIVGWIARRILKWYAVGPAGPAALVMEIFLDENDGISNFYPVVLIPLKDTVHFWFLIEIKIFTSCGWYKLDPIQPYEYTSTETETR